MRRVLPLLLFVLFWNQIAVAQAPSPLPVTGNLTQILGQPQAYASVQFQLQNCASPITIPSYYGIVQTQLTLQANSAGYVNGSIWPTDKIDCNGTTGASMYQVTYVVQGVPQGTPQCYQPVSTMGTWNLATLQPITCSSGPPNPQDGQYQNLNVTGVLTASSANLSGTVKAFLQDTSGQVYNAVANGMKCDGTTNDAAAFQSLLNTAQAGNPVLIPAGTCVIATGVTLPAPGAVSIIGSGKLSSILKFTGTGTFFKSSAPSAVTDSAMLRPRIEDLEILNGGAASNVALNLDGMEQGDVNRVRFVGFQTAIIAVDTVGYASYGMNFDADDFLQSSPQCCTAEIQAPAIILGPGNDGTGGLNTGHFTFVHPLVEGYAVALEENYASNVTFQDADVEYSCQSVYVLYATASYFINDYLDANETSGQCSVWGTHGVRYQINAGDGNFINPLFHNGGTGTNSINQYTTSYLDPQVGNNYLQGNLSLNGNIQLNNAQKLCALNSSGSACFSGLSVNNSNNLIVGDATNLPPVYYYGTGHNFNTKVAAPEFDISPNLTTLYTVIPPTVTGYQGNASGTKTIVSIPWGTSGTGSTTRICHDTNGNITDQSCPSTPIRAGTWSISSATSVAVTFSPAMSAAPTSCTVNPSASSATTGQPYATGFTTTGFTVNVPTSGSLSGTYQCVINNSN